MKKRGKKSHKKHIFWSIISITLCLVFTLFIVYTPKSNADSIDKIGIQPGWPIDDSGNILITDEMADRLKNTGATWIRINFRLGPYPSDTDEFYQKYDEIVDRLRSRNLEIIGLMSNESYLGSQQDWTENNYEHTGGDGDNPYIQNYSLAFGRLAKHFEGKIRYWEIWNEPNGWTQQEPNDPSIFGGGTFIYPSNFAAMLTESDAQVHYHNSIDVVVISGGLLGHDLNGLSEEGAGAKYLDDTYKAGIEQTGKFTWAKQTYGKYPLDEIGQHIYINQGGQLDPNSFRMYLDFIHQVIIKWEGDDSRKKTFVTEFGWQTSSVDESTQGENLTRAFDIVKNTEYVVEGNWFELDDSPLANLYYGLYTPDGSQKQSLFAFSNYTQGTIALITDQMYHIRHTLHL